MIKILIHVFFLSHTLIILPFGIAHDINICYIISRKDGMNMETIKTAISIQKSLFEKAEDLARKMKVPRSRLYALALQDYLRRRENVNLFAQINAAHADEPEASEKNLRQKSKRTHRRLVEGQW